MKDEKHYGTFFPKDDILTDIIKAIHNANKEAYNNYMNGNYEWNDLEMIKKENIARNVYKVLDKYGCQKVK